MEIFAETERLILREILPTDEMGMFELDSDSEVHAYLGNKPIKTVEEARQTINFIRQQYVDIGIGRWAVVEKQTGEFIGWAGLKLIQEEINKHMDFYDVGYRLIKEYWGKGFATEAAIASVNYGFNILNLNEIFGMAHIGNIASIKVLEKVGLKIAEEFDFKGIQHFWLKIERPAIF